MGTGLHFRAADRFSGMRTRGNYGGQAATAADQEEDRKKLNKKYSRYTGDTFFLFHRPAGGIREQVWMKFERASGNWQFKRPVAHGRENATSFCQLIVGNTEILSGKCDASTRVRNS